MKAFLLAVCFLVVFSAFSQEKVLSISNSETGKVTVFKQNERVKIKTLQGGKIKGTLFIADDNQIMIKNILVPISNIEKIKRNPLVLNILVSGTLFFIGGYGVLGGLVVLAWSGEALGAILLITGAASITAGILSPNFLPNTVIGSNSNIKVETLLQ
ncbi:MAG: hypothetical protein V2I31_03070 [Mariniphaga sp.]|jgi:hypothetical protein|nr:hypothetical protein [Mariniphaga sp.]